MLRDLAMQLGQLIEAVCAIPTIGHADTALLDSLIAKTSGLAVHVAQQNTVSQVDRLLQCTLGALVGVRAHSHLGAGELWTPFGRLSRLCGLREHDGMAKLESSIFGYRSSCSQELSMHKYLFVITHRGAYCLSCYTL